MRAIAAEPNALALLVSTQNDAGVAVGLLVDLEGDQHRLDHAIAALEIDRPALAAAADLIADLDLLGIAVLIRHGDLLELDIRAADLELDPLRQSFLAANVDLGRPRF